jgi:TfoX/Sxy family transcriptional regulator of competence genes
MDFEETLVTHVRRALARKKGIEEKKMFGGIGFLLNGNLLVGVRKGSLVLRLGTEEGETALLEANVKVFDITGRAMKGWVVVDRDGVEDERQVKKWIQRAIKFVGKLPAK